MKLNEKIYHCRKKAGLSQEALAEQIGVSRQAISKWETGEASPDLSKLPLLAQTWQVTTDWLLSEDDEPADPMQEEPAPQAHPYTTAGHTSGRSYPDWVDKLPHFLGSLIRRYGWLVGLRMAIAGALFTAMGFVAKAMFTSMLNHANEQMSGMLGGFGSSGVTFYDSAGNMLDPSHFGLTSADLNAMGLSGSTGFGFSGFDLGAGMGEPFAIFCNFIIITGLALLIGGAVLAWYLKKWGSEA